jgi:tetratricopeptide (TPR) repeat protein
MRVPSLKTPDRPSIPTETGLSDGGMGAGDFEHAVEQAVPPGANGPEFPNNRGAARHARRDFMGVLLELDRVLELNPQDAEAYNDRGTARRACGDIDQAFADFDRALDLNPGYAEAYTNRGMVRYGRGDLEAAIADFDRALACIRHRDAVATASNWGTARRRDFDGALADSSGAPEFDPRDCIAYIARGDARYHKRDAECETDYRTAFLLDPELAAIEIVRRLQVEMQDNLAYVLTNCRTRLRIDPQDVVARIRLGLTLIIYHEDHLALRDLQRVFTQSALWRPFLRLLIDEAKEQRATPFA